MKQIPLTKGYVALVDDEDYEWLNKHKWCAAAYGSVVYAKRHFEKVSGVRKYSYMHREILGITERYQFVDHIDMNTLNNQRTNLRPCSRSQNMCNQRRRGRNMKYRGIYITENKKGYIARVEINKKVFRSKTFHTEIDAAKEYDRLSILHHKEFGRLNFPEDYSHLQNTQQ